MRALVPLLALEDEESHKKIEDDYREHFLPMLGLPLHLPLRLLLPYESRRELVRVYVLQRVAMRLDDRSSSGHESVLARPQRIDRRR